MGYFGSLTNSYIQLHVSLSWVRFVGFFVNEFILWTWFLWVFACWITPPSGRLWHWNMVCMYLSSHIGPEDSGACNMASAWCWLNGLGGGLGIQGSWVQIPLRCWINTRWGWLYPSSFWGRQNECQLAGILCRGGDPSRIVSNNQGDCLGSTNALHRVWSWWMDGGNHIQYIWSDVL